MSPEAKKSPDVEVIPPMSEAKTEILEKMKEVLTASDDDLVAKNDRIAEFVEVCTHLPEGQEGKDWLKDEIARQAETWCKDGSLPDARQITEYAEELKDGFKDEIARQARTWCKEDERLQDVKLIIDYAKDLKANYEDFREHLDQGKSVGSWIVTSEMAKGLFEKMNEDLCASDEDFKRLHDLIGDFVESYEHRPDGQDYKDWLKDEFVRRSKTWASENELLQDYKQIVDYAEVVTANYKEFREHIDQGKSAASWIAEKMESGAKALGIETSQYAQSIEEAMQKANQEVSEQFEKVRIDVSEKFGIEIPGGKQTIIRGPAGRPPVSGLPAEWNEFTRISIAKDASMECLDNACGNIAVKGAGMLAQRFYNTATGKEQRDLGDDLEDFCKSSLKDAVNAGLGSAVSGAMTVFGRSSQSTVLRAIPGGAMAATAFDVLDKTRILYQAADGSLDPVEAIDAVANSTFVTYGSVVGGSFGATAGSIVGSVFGPVGTAVGGAVGAVVGTLAGSSVGQKVYEGVKKVGSAVGSAVKSAASAVGSAVSSFCSSVGSFFSSLW